MKNDHWVTTYIYSEIGTRTAALRNQVPRMSKQSIPQVIIFHAFCLFDFSKVTIVNFCAYPQQHERDE